MSGTPLQNNTFDIYAQMNFLNPGLLGSVEFFRNEFATPINKFGEQEQKEHLRNLLYPFILRRTKEQVAKDLPENHIEYNAGALPLTVEQALTPRNGLSAEETIRRIETCKSWMVLKWVHHDPEYNELLQSCLDQIRPLTEAIAPGMRFAQAYIFLTSPG